MAPHLRPDILHKRGGVRVLQADFNGAIDDYNEALSREPDNPIYYISRGNARYHRRDLSRVARLPHGLPPGR